MRWMVNRRMQRLCSQVAYARNIFRPALTWEFAARELSLSQSEVFFHRLDARRRFCGTVIGSSAARRFLARSKSENLCFCSCPRGRSPIASSRSACYRARQKYISEESLTPHFSFLSVKIENWQLYSIIRNQLIKPDRQFVRMSTSITSTFVVASPSTFPFLHEQPASSYEATPSLGTSRKECGIRELSRQQWESLKQLIQRVYIDEDKPFPYLAQILRSEHGFEPT